MAQLGLRALQEHDAQKILEEAVEIVASTLDHELCKVLELLPDRRALVLRAGVGWAPGLVGHGTVSAGLESQAGYTLMHGGPLVVPDLRNETRFDGPPLLHNHGVVSGLSTPIYTSRGPWGVLGTHSRSKRSHTRQDQDFLVAVANILGAAVEREQYEHDLRAAKARLEELDALRVRFLHNVAHELRTPLTPLLVQLEVLAGSAAAEGLRHGLEVSRRSARRLKRLVDDFLDVTRLQAGTLRLRMDPLDLSKAAHETLDAYRAYAEQKGINLEEDMQGPLPIQGDAGRLQQVVGNLLDNAIKFTSEGGTVTLRARKDGDFALVEVEDTGSGMEPQQAGLLFEPFSQLDASRDPQAGLGFGLYVAKGIVQQHGGMIGVESAGAGQGSRFWFTIRLAAGARLTETAGRT